MTCVKLTFVGETLFINCDGGAKGNPGPAAAAFIVKRGSKRIFAKGEFIGEATNNVAEYRGVIAALSWINQNSKDINDLPIIFFLDSQLVTNQLLGVFKIKNPTLKKLLEQAKLLEIKSQKNISYKLIPRERNGDADFLVKQTLKNV